MKTTLSRLAKGTIIAAMSLVAMPSIAQEEAPKADWGDFKLFLDPGHSGRENRGIWGYSEAEKVLDVALNIKDMLETYTTVVDGETLKLCRYTQEESVDLSERSDMANAWGADFFYSIHSDASGSENTIVTLFGGWRENGVEVEKTPNGGKAYGEFLEPNLMGVMRVGSRGNWYDRCYYDRTPETHESLRPYLSVNRLSNMPSLLSEGGYHDMAVQQRRNMNKDYKRLEAFAAFQSILQYRGMALPAQTFMTGVISNSENEQPINGATIKVGDYTYTTDTYESLFSQYTKNPDLISNGFYIFEGLTAGETYNVEISAPGFDTYTSSVTINDGSKVEGTTTSPDYVTFFDVALTNNQPAKVASISVEDIESVNSLVPLVITFSRNMDRESVESAFAISNKGEVALSWDNDYTLKVDISKLQPWMTYKITIDGSVAKNSQTGLLLDGDADGEPGGNYELTFTMAEPDVTAPFVVSTYPAAEGEALYTKRPPIRLEFNEEIVYNGDKHAECVTVEDATGKKYEGVTTHDVVRDRSVIHFYPKEDLAADCAILVSFAGGIEDLFGNLGEPYYFRFLTEYRAQTEETVIQALAGADGWWAPGGSGSSSGLVIDDCSTTTVNVGPSVDATSSMSINYVFDESASYDEANPNAFFIRDHYPSGQNTQYTELHAMLTMWVYGDGSNNQVGVCLRARPDGVKQTEPMMPLDFRGWNLYVFDLWNGEVSHISGSETNLQKQVSWCLDAVSMRHAYTDPEDEETPYQEWTGSVYFNGLTMSKWDDQAARTAKLEDVTLPGAGGVEDLLNNNAPVEYFNLQGIRVANPENGVYIRRQGTNVSKVVK